MLNIKTTSSSSSTHKKQQQHHLHHNVTTNYGRGLPLSLVTIVLEKLQNSKSTLKPRDQRVKKTSFTTLQHFGLPNAL